MLPAGAGGDVGSALSGTHASKPSWPIWLAWRSVTGSFGLPSTLHRSAIASWLPWMETANSCCNKVRAAVAVSAAVGVRVGSGLELARSLAATRHAFVLVVLPSGAGCSDTAGLSGCCRAGLSEQQGRTGLGSVDVNGGLKSRMYSKG